MRNSLPTSEWLSKHRQRRRGCSKNNQGERINDIWKKMDSKRQKIPVKITYIIMWPPVTVYASLHLPCVVRLLTCCYCWFFPVRKPVLTRITDQHTHRHSHTSVGVDLETGHTGRRCSICTKHGLFVRTEVCCPQCIVQWEGNGFIPLCLDDLKERNWMWKFARNWNIQSFNQLQWSKHDFRSRFMTP